MDLDQKRYEIAYLISPEVAEDDVVRVAGIVTKIISDVGGTVKNVTEPKKRHLFYPINKSRFAYLGVTTFSAGTNAPAETTKLLKLEKEIVRLLIVDELKETIRPSGFRAQWQPSEGVAPVKREPVKKDATPLSAEERIAAIETIDKKLEEILGA